MPKKTIASLEAKIKELETKIKDLESKVPVQIEEGACYWDGQTKKLIISDELDNPDLTVQDEYYFNNGHFGYIYDEVQHLIKKVNADGSLVNE